MRTFTWFAALALTAASYAQDGKVTYTTVAVSAKKAIAGLAEKTGMKMACAPAMEKEILILRLQDAPVDQVMAQIAAATLGTWSKEGDVTYLVPNGNLRSGEASRIQQRFAARIADNLKKQRDAYAKARAPKNPKDTKGTDAGDTTTSAPAGFAGFGGMDSGQEQMLKLALAIGANQLSLVPESGRVVYSSNPTRMQRPLPSGSDQIIGDFVTEYNKTAALAKQDEPAKDAADENMAMFMELFGNKMKKPQPITTAPATAIVVASRRAMFVGYTLELKLYDAQGKMLASSTFSIQSDMPFDIAAMTKPETAPKDDGPELELSPLSKELSKANSGFMMPGQAANMKFSKELMDALKDPVGHDPLSFIHSDALISIATQRKEQLVADLPDGVMSFFENLAPKSKLTADSFLKEIKGDDKTRVVESNGWLVVSPENFVKARLERTDRDSLRALVKGSVELGYTSLDNLSAYAMKNEAPLMDAPASTTYVMLFAPGALQQGMMGSVDWDLLRLYGMMDSTQRQSLRQGGRLPFGQLSPDQQAQVSKMLFGANGVLLVENPNDTKKKQDPLTEMIMSQIDRFTGGNENDFRSEPTEIMPNGLPSDGFIVVKFTTDPVAQPQTMSTDIGRGSALGPMELGMFKFFKEDPTMSQLGGMMPTFDDMKVGTRSVYDFSLYVAPSVSEKGQLNDDVFPKDAPVYKMANLPGDFVKRIDEMAASFKGNPIWQMLGKMGALGQKGVPPPRP